MSEEKNIDKLFKEQLKDFEMAPEDAVWKHIEAELDKDKRKRRVIPMWWKYGGVAAALLVLIAITNSFINTASKGIDTEIVDTEKTIKQPTQNDSLANNLKPNSFKKENQEAVAHTKNKKNHITPAQNQRVKPPVSTANTKLSTVEGNTTKKSTSKERNTTKGILTNRSGQQDAVTSAQINRSKDTSTGNTTKPTVNSVTTASKGDTAEQKVTQDPLKKEQQQIDKLLQQPNTKVTSVHTDDKDNMTIGNDSSKTKTVTPIENAIEQAIVDSKSEENNISKDSINTSKRWSLAPNIAPVYFNSLGNGSSIDAQFVDNSKEGDINMSYGIKGAYAISSKFTIRAGINKVNLGYSTNDIMAFSESSTSSTLSRTLQHVDTKDDASIYLSANNISLNNGPEILSIKEQGSINQELGFIEVPIEIAYNVIDSKIGVNLIGGFSTLFLSDNDVYSVVNSGSRTRLGEASNINDMSYSANFGIGVNYNISNQLRFNLEPTFKYQINTFNDTSGNFQPFFIGVYTGLSFKF